MITEEQKDAWVNALRSGEYAQGVGVLKQITHSGRFAYCCLGVLEELINPTSDALVIEPGLHRSDGTMLSCNILSFETQADLMRANDSGENFDQIADLIESGSLHITK